MERISFFYPTLSYVLPYIVLISKSENRKALFEENGVKVSVFVSDAPEIKEGESGEYITKVNAERKIYKYLNSESFSPSLPALSADTLVEFDNKIIGKSESEEEARKTLFLFSGKTHKVITSSFMYIPKKEKVYSLTDSAYVTFLTLRDKDVDLYIKRGEWKGAAGSYRVQKTGFTLIEKIEGDKATVVGLPIEKLLSLL